MEREQRRWGRDPHQVTRSSARTFRLPLRCDPDKKVFVCSWSDFFHPEADPWRPEAWEIIQATPWLFYQILTKRPERIWEALPPNWGKGWPNVWFGRLARSCGSTSGKRSALLGSS